VSLSRSAGRAGEVLVLTKSLGTGVVAAAAAAGACPPPLEAAARAARAAPDAPALEAAAAAGVTAGVPVGEDGLLGHLQQMAAASGVGAAVRVDRVPVFDGVLALAGRHRDERADRNRERFGENVDVHEQVTAEARALLWDPQEDGGLVLAVPAAGLQALLQDLGARGVRGIAIGQLIPEPVGRVGVVTPVNRLGVTGGGSRTAAVEPPEGAPPPPPPPAGPLPPA
jgi:selenide,water dikinase